MTGTRLRYLTAGESHGPGLVAILEGMPAGVPVSMEDFTDLCRRRWAGYGRGPRRKIESDQVEIISGVIGGFTIGSPISILIRNSHRSLSVSAPDAKAKGMGLHKCHVPRPGHADLPGMVKFGFEDSTPVRERASARETAIRVALSVPARNFLKSLKIRSVAFVRRIGRRAARPVRGLDESRLLEIIEKTGPEFLSPDPDVIPIWRSIIDEARDNGKTLGGEVEVRFYGLPIGLGSHAHWDRRLDAVLAGHCMSIPGVKAVEIGEALSQSRLSGAHAQDPFRTEPGKPFRRKTNLAGGLEGGMTNGEPLVVRCTFKPPPGGSESLSIDFRTGGPARVPPQRSDTAPLPAVAIVAESLIAITLADEVLVKFGGDSLPEILRRFLSGRPEKASPSGRKSCTSPSMGDSTSGEGHSGLR